MCLVRHAEDIEGDVWVYFLGNWGSLSVREVLSELDLSRTVVVLDDSEM